MARSLAYGLAFVCTLTWDLVVGTPFTAHVAQAYEWEPMPPNAPAEDPQDPPAGCQSISCVAPASGTAGGEEMTTRTRPVSTWRALLNIWSIWRPEQ